MRRAAIVLQLAVLVACGSSDKSPPLFGGFTPQDGAAVILAPTTCSILSVGSTSAAALAIGFTSFGGACNFATTTLLCGSRANSTLLLALAIGGRVGGGTVGALGPGTYPYLANPPTGSFVAATASAARTDASCNALPGSPLGMTGGSIVVSSVTATRVAGSLDLQFKDGTAYQQPFDLAICPVTVDLCSLVGSLGCVPGIPPWVCIP
jgi:hypothetical protein